MIAFINTRLLVCQCQSYLDLAANRETTMVSKYSTIAKEAQIQRRKMLASAVRNVALKLKVGQFQQIHENQINVSGAEGE